MKLQPIKACLLLIIISLLSCTNKKQEILLKESAKRLEHQNAIGLKANRELKAFIRNRIFDGYSRGRYEYLNPSLEYFTENVKRFSESVSYAKMPNAKDRDTLFGRYQNLQHAYKILRKKILDSFPYVKFDTSINGFMNLDRRAFNQKYLDTMDSTNSKLQLLFLQADAITNEDFFVGKIAEILMPTHHFDPVVAWGSTDKLFYKRGEKMEVTAALVKYLPSKIQYATIDGKRVEVAGDIFQYTRKIIEQPGIHDLRFTIFTKKDGMIEAYPVATKYKVE